MPQLPPFSRISAPEEVPGHFLSDLFAALEREGIPARGLLGDLPIRLGEGGNVLGHVAWNHFTDFMRRLEHHVGGPSGLEACGEAIADVEHAAAIRILAGLSASPKVLYRATIEWALRRALPGLEARVVILDPGHLEIRARLAIGLRPCPEIFHLATGWCRALPRLMGLQDAVVSPLIEAHHATYRIILPPSSSFFARIKRIFRAIHSSGDVLQYLEAQQLELHAKNHALQNAHDALAESEWRYKTITDAAVDVLCEIDDAGRLVYVSRSIQDLIGYSPEQVTGSHFRLWLLRDHHEEVNSHFDSLLAMRDGSTTQNRLSLRAEGGESVRVELTARVCETAKGARRIVCIIRDLSNPHSPIGRPPTDRARNTQHRTDAVPPPQSLPESPNLLDDSSMQEADWVSLAPEELEEKKWMESWKLMRTARDMFLSGPSAIGIEVQIDLEQAPTDIWADESQLLVGIVRLLDWAAAASSANKDEGESRTLYLRAIESNGHNHFQPQANQKGQNRGHPRSISIEVAIDPVGPNARAGTAARAATDEASPPESPEKKAKSDRLAFALAKEAIATLGGRLSRNDGTTESPRETSQSKTSQSESRRVLQRFELPQPRHT